MSGQRTLPQQGYILVTALVFMAILMLLGTLMITGSVSGIQQAGGFSGLVRTRAAAEAGQASSAFDLRESIITDLNTILKPYADSFAASKFDAKVTPIVADFQYKSVEISLNSLPTVVKSGSLEGVTYTSKVVFANFRADQEYTAIGQTYYVDYKVESIGKQNKFTRRTATNGTLAIQMGRKYLNQFLLLADDGGSEERNYFTTDMNYDGPVHVNKNWMFTGQPRFSLGATTAAREVKMTDCKGKSFLVSTQSLPPCTTPDWGNRSLQYGQSSIELPTNSASQKAISLGPNFKGTVSTIKDVCDALGVKDNDCKSAVPTGVYLPPAGGLYIQGNAEIIMSKTAAEQVYTVKQGTTVTTITVNYVTKRTKIVSGTTTTERDGVPNGQLYVEGEITSLKGPERTGALPSSLPATAVPSQVVPALHPLSQLNIAATSNIVLTGDLTYTDDPRQVVGAKNVLGLIAGTGSVLIGNDARNAPSDIYIHAAILAGAANKGFGVMDVRRAPAQGSIHLLGSVAASKEPPRGVFSFQSDGLPKLIGGYGDDFSFDQRFLNGGTVPPNFPATSRFEAKTALPTQTDWTED
ncbi:DUF4900 domain-containing protein [Deinococcus sp. QL22]|uniref:DUF4900 domain-containing protein n=1 Tax=Deinococcus sp. QL22 TaxID=2939437 RepID=UPI0020177E9B|nr:DUF4900 domain-containing protein [Deinococcus sp. QL22]UQN09992.1 DUF4900 domain-containing protein [Deinococcus sp. QL22]